MWLFCVTMWKALVSLVEGHIRILCGMQLVELRLPVPRTAGQQLTTGGSDRTNVYKRLRQVCGWVSRAQDERVLVLRSVDVQEDALV